MANRYYQVLVGKEDIDETELHNPIGKSDISIVPVITGAGGGLGKTLLGVALIGFAVLAPGAGFMAGGGLGLDLLLLVSFVFAALLKYWYWSNSYGCW